MNSKILKLITFIHSLLIVFLLLVPFFGNNYFLFLHSIIVPFILMHWILNNSMCSVTIAEQAIRKKIYGSYEIDDCVSCQIIQPIYDFNITNIDKVNIAYIILGSLWGISITRLIIKYINKEIVNIKDLFVL